MRERGRTSASPADICIGLTLIAVTFGLYANVRHFDYIDYDDADYALAPAIRHGVTADAVKWAFTSTDNFNWFPLTRLSHLLDYTLFGPASGPPHVVNVVIHTLASLMLFAFLRGATGERWKSAFVAAVFAWHPLHVESVAWIAERKDVLCGLFWFLTLWLWVGYARRPGPLLYLSALLSFSLGLLSKPMIVTLPIVLLLIDRWPLGRPFSKKLVLEKLPFLALAAAGATLAWLAQAGGGAVASLEKFPPGLRIENSLLSYAVYAGNTLAPARLAFWYPFSYEIPAWEPAVSAVGLVLISIYALLSFKALPWLATGWFWFLGTLIPVIGLVQVGEQAHADRYMYIPMVGLLVVIAWGAGAIASRWPATRTALRAAGAVACISLLPVAWYQIQLWRDSRSLFSHAIAVTSGNYVAYNNLGTYVAYSNIDVYRTGASPLDTRPTAARLKEALGDFEMARRIKNDYPEAWYNIGLMQMTNGNLAEAGRDFAEAVRLRPGYGDAHNNLGITMVRTGHSPDAVPEFVTAVRLMPKSVPARLNLGRALLRSGRVDEAVDTLEEAVALAPRDAAVHDLLGTALAMTPGRTADAVDHLREAISLDATLATAHANLARVLLQLPGRHAEAVSEARTAVKISPQDPAMRRFLSELENSVQR